MKKYSLALVVFSLLSMVSAQLTFDPANPPAQMTPPTEQYHQWVDSAYTTWDRRNTSHQKGPKTVLVIMVRPSDGPVWSDPPTFATLDSQLDESSQSYYNGSYHQTWFGPKRSNNYDVPRLVVTAVLDLPETASTYRGSFGLLESHCLWAVRAQGGEWNGGRLDPNNFDRRVPMSNVKMISSTGLAGVGGKFAWVGNSLSGGVTMHEWGHNWGVYHANSWEVPTGEHPRSPNGSNDEYQDGWGLMGGNGANVMFNPLFRKELKFLEEDRGEIQRITVSDTYRIYDYVHADRRQTPSLVRALMLPMLPPNPYYDWNREVYLGFGHIDATDGGFTRSDYNRNAVTVHSKLSNGSNRIDTTPGSRPGVEDRNDSSIKIGRTYSEAANNNMNADGFHVTPVLRGSSVVNGQTHEWIEVVINFDADTGANQPPTASFPQTLITDAQPGVPYNITVTASDPDSDPLAFDWDFGDDTYNIVNSGSPTKTWATAGVYLVRATVSDMKGGTATAEVWVNVGNVPFRSPENPAGTLAGLSYTYYHGTYNQLPNWDNLLPVKQGAVDSFSLSPRTRESGYAFVYEGYVEIPTNDVYTFTLASKDGSRLYIGDTLLIGNDGLKSQAAPASGNIALNIGKHRIRVEMFNRDGNGILGVEWSTLSLASTAIPASALSRDDPAALTPPTVSITSPNSGINTIVGGDMTISANASSALGIDRVVFFIGSAYLGEDNSIPYSIAWNNLPVGTFFLSAVAYDTQGNFAVSTPALVNVVSPVQRDSIGINFLGTDGAAGTLATSDQAGAFFLQANWNNAPQGTFSLTDPTHWDATFSDLKDRDGLTTAAWTRYRSRRHESHSPNGTILVDNSTANGRLMRGGLKVRGDTAGPIVEVYSIPYANYDVYVYFDQHEGVSDDVTPMQYTLTPGGQSQLPSLWGQNSMVAGDGLGDYPNYDTWVGFKEASATSPGAPVDERLGNYLIFRNISATSFLLVANNPGSAINAVQIVSTAENPTIPNIYAQPQSLSLPETRSAEFKVRYVGFPTPTVAWYKVGIGALGVSGDTLVLENISPADAGDYYAIATNSQGTDTSAHATLTVTDPPPATPVDLVAQVQSTSEIELTWIDAATDEDSFIVQRGASVSGPWAFVATLPANSSIYVDSSLPENTEFFYRVIAQNEKGESNPSNVASGTTLTSPRDITILQQPVTTGAIVGQSASLTVVADGYPEPNYQWSKDGEEIPGAVGATFTLENAALSDHGSYTVLVSNMQSEEESDPAMIVVTEPFPFAINALHVINDGSVSETGGTYTLTRSGSDAFQGIVSNFQEVPLLETGDYLELSFSLRSNTANNGARTISFGFFHGPNVTGNAQTLVTDLWQGYLHQPGSRDSDGAMSYNFARQGAGPIGLMDVALGGQAFDGVNYIRSMTGFHQEVLTPVTLRLERISATQIRLISVFTTPDSDRSASGTNNGIVWNYATVSGVCTANSTFPVADGPEAFNGFAIATRGNWVLQVNSISTNVNLVEPPPPPPAPGNLTATAVSGSQIDLSWSDMSDVSDLSDSFRIERSADGSTGWSTLTTVTGTSHSDSGLSGGSTWYYRVIAQRDGISSEPSAVASATTPTDPAPPVITQHPQSQTVGEGQDAIFTAAATGNPAPSYQWRKNGADLGGETADTLTLLAVDSSDAADYSVFVSNGIGSGVLSSAATLTVTAPPPPAPTNLQATAAAFDQIDLAWSDASDLSDLSDSFRIERSSNGSSGWSTLTTVPATSHSDTGLSGGSTWYYRVIALRDGLESDPSTVASATTPAAPAAPIIHVTRPLDGVAAIPSGVGLWILATVELDPAISSVNLQWTHHSGPGVVTFTRPQEASTGATFTENGSHVLRLTADDGLNSVTRDILVEVGAISGAPQRVQAVTWGSSYNMGRLGAAGGPGTNSGVTQASFGNFAGESALSDSRRYRTLYSTTAPLINSGGADIGSRNFFYAYEQLTVDTGTAPGTGNLFLGPTASYSTSLDWRASATYTSILHVWEKTNFLNITSEDVVTFGDPTSALSVQIRSNQRSGTIRFVVRNGDIWYVSEQATTGSGTFTLSNPESVSWSVFNPDNLEATPGSLWISNPSFAPRSFTDIQAVGFLINSLISSVSEHRIGFDNFTASLTIGGAANLGPQVDAGTLAAANVGEAASLNGSASDDGEPAAPGEVVIEWGLESGPGAAPFGDAAALQTTVTFDTAGPHTLRLVADDGAVATFDLLTVTVEATVIVPPVLDGLLMTGTGQGLRLQTQSVYEYRLEYTDTLTGTFEWLPMGDWTPGNDGQLDFMDNTPVLDQRFYRLSIRHRQ